MYSRKSLQKILLLCILFSIGLGIFIFTLKEKREIRLETVKLVESVFLPTIENEKESREDINNMVWIPGGTFSMGCNTSDESLCSIGGITKDAQPIQVMGKDNKLLLFCGPSGSGKTTIVHDLLDSDSRV